MADDKAQKKPELYLADSNAESIAAVFRAMTGRELSPEAYREIEEALRPDEPAKP
ncbi:MAG TPA: hypothetical protein VFM88_17350 [Vicinamibacteria bacterium]|nr:hypothetical protein [Vicinamibacteria bacterium]